MKLSSLTEQDKIKLAAELDGWTPLDDNKIWWHKAGEMRRSIDSLTLWFNSYNGIIPLVQKQLSQIQQKIWEYLELEDDYYPYQKTPPQLLDALLVATGKAEL